MTHGTASPKQPLFHTVAALVTYGYGHCSHAVTGILFYMTTSAFDAVIEDFPMYYDAILNKAMERLEKTLRSNASLEVRMRQHGFHQAILSSSACSGMQQGCNRM